MSDPIPAAGPEREEWLVRYEKHARFGAVLAFPFLCGTEPAAIVAEIRRLDADLALARGSVAAQDERERVAGGVCGVPWHEHGCDWPDAVAEEVLVLRRVLAEERAAWASDATLRREQRERLEADLLCARALAAQEKARAERAEAALRAAEGGGR